MNQFEQPKVPYIQRAVNQGGHMNEVKERMGKLIWEIVRRNIAVSNGREGVILQR